MLDIPLAIINTFVIFLQTIWILLLAAWRFPIRATLLGAFVGSSVWIGAHQTVSVITYSIVGLVVWWATGRLLARFADELRLYAAYQLLVGRRLYSAWRRWFLYERRWQRTLEGQHLTRVIDNGYDDVPKLSRVTTTRAGDIVRVKVLPGQTEDHYRGMDGQTAKALAKAFRARECRIRDIAQTDYIELWLPRGRDPLKDTIPFPGIPESTADVSLRKVPIGVDERGRAVTVPVLGAHVLTGGLTGAGKGSVMWSILLHLEPYVREGSVVLHGVDPKRGVELVHCRHLFKDLCVSSNGKDIAEYLAPLIAIMDESADRITAAGLRRLDPSPEHPLHVVVIDELGRLSDDNDCKALIKTLVNVGRAPGMSVLGFLQQPTKRTLESRDEWPVKVALKLESRDYVKMLLGRVAYLAGARCDEIPLSMPGVGYLKVEALADELNDHARPPWFLRWLPWNRGEDVVTQLPPTRFRAFWVANELLAQVNDSFDPDAPEPGVEPDQPEPVAA